SRPPKSNPARIKTKRPPDRVRQPHVPPHSFRDDGIPPPRRGGYYISDRLIVDLCAVRRAGDRAGAFARAGFTRITLARQDDLTIGGLQVEVPLAVLAFLQLITTFVRSVCLDLFNAVLCTCLLLVPLRRADDLPVASL